MSAAAAAADVANVAAAETGPTKEDEETALKGKKAEVLKQLKVFVKNIKGKGKKINYKKAIGKLFEDIGNEFVENENDKEYNPLFYLCVEKLFSGNTKSKLKVIRDTTKDNNVTSICLSLNYFNKNKIYTDESNGDKNKLIKYLLLLIFLSENDDSIETIYLTQYETYFRENNLEIDLKKKKDDNVLDDKTMEDLIKIQVLLETNTSELEEKILESIKTDIMTQLAELKKKIEGEISGINAIIKSIRLMGGELESIFELLKELGKKKVVETLVDQIFPVGESRRLLIKCLTYFEQSTTLTAEKKSGISLINKLLDSIYARMKEIKSKRDIKEQTPQPQSDAGQEIVQSDFLGQLTSSIDDEYIKNFKNLIDEFNIKDGKINYSEALKKLTKQDEAKKGEEEATAAKAATDAKAAEEATVAKEAADAKVAADAKAAEEATVAEEEKKSIKPIVNETPAKIVIDLKRKIKGEIKRKEEEEEEDEEEDEGEEGEGINSIYVF